jgi:hypothetical protein
MDAWAKAMFGEDGEAAPSGLLDSFFEMPLAKLATFGAVSEQDLAGLVALAGQQPGAERS